MSIEQPFVLENALSTEMFYDVWSELDPDHNPWVLNNSAHGTNGEDFREVVSWGKDRFDCNNSALKAASFLKLKIERVLKRRLTLVKIQHNLQTANQANDFHTDFESNSMFSVILFTTPRWSVMWGGEFVVQTPDKKYRHYTYIPNTAVCIKTNWEHTGMPPNIMSGGNVRTSLAFSYVYSDMFDKVYMRQIINGNGGHDHFRKFNNKISWFPDNIPLY